MRMHVSFAAPVAFAIVSSATTAFSQCQIAEPVAKALQALPSQTAGLGLYRTEGLTYLDMRCLDEARAAFQKELIEARSSAPDRQESESAFANLLLELTEAFFYWNKGDLTEAKRIFTDLSDSARPSVVNIRAVFALAELLLQSPDPLAWARLEPKLKDLDETRHQWIARRYRLLYGLTLENAPARIHSIEVTLNGDLPIPERLEDQIILTTLLRKAGRSMEARLLATDIEADVGSKVVSPDLRVAYVRECAAIASEEARHGDAEAAVRYQKYLAALGEMYAPH